MLEGVLQLARDGTAQVTFINLGITQKIEGGAEVGRT